MTNFEKPEWYALYTKSRHEKFVESRLGLLGMEAYTPTLTIKKHWSDRVKSVDEPLFKSYCFAKFPLINKRKVLIQKGVVKIVNFNNAYVSVENSVIDSIKIMLATDLKNRPMSTF